MGKPQSPNPNHVVLNETKYVQEQTLNSIKKTKAQLAQTEELASDTMFELKEQRNQTDRIVLENERLKTKLKTSQKLQDRLDRWQFRWTGKSKRLAKKEAKEKVKVEGRIRQLTPMEDEDPAINSIRKKHASASIHRSRQRSPRNISDPSNAPTVLLFDSSEQQEAAAAAADLDDTSRQMLNDVRNTDRAIDDALGDIDESLNILSDLARNMTEEVCQSTAAIEKTSESVDKTNRKLYEVQTRTRWKLGKKGRRNADRA